MLAAPRQHVTQLGMVRRAFHLPKRITTPTRRSSLKRTHASPADRPALTMWHITATVSVNPTGPIGLPPRRAKRYVSPARATLITAPFIEISATLICVVTSQAASEPNNDIKAMASRMRDRHDSIHHPHDDIVDLQKIPENRPNSRPMAVVTATSGIDRERNPCAVERSRQVERPN